MSQTDLPQSSIFSRLVGIAGILLSHALALFFVMVVLVKIVPTYAAFFDLQDDTLPAATLTVVYWSESWVAYWFPFFFLIMVIDTIAVSSLALLASGKPRIVSAYSHFCLLVACALLVYIGAGLSIPIYRLAQWEF